MLYEVMKHVKNFFPYFTKNGTFVINGGTINVSELKNGQYFLIEGSLFSDGVYQYPPSGLTDETFVGFVIALNPPQAFLKLVEDITKYCEEQDQVSPYVSESFGGYSYSKATNSNGQPIDWPSVFAERLKPWRKM